MRIISVAIKSEDGQIHSVPRPGRHHDVIKMMVARGYPTPIKGVQGFLTDELEFVNRRAAKHIAKRAGQLLERASTSADLFSEDVW